MSLRVIELIQITAIAEFRDLHRHVHGCFCTEWSRSISKWHIPWISRALVVTNIQMDCWTDDWMMSHQETRLQQRRVIFARALNTSQLGRNHGGASIWWPPQSVHSAKTTTFIFDIITKHYLLTSVLNSKIDVKAWVVCDLSLGLVAPSFKNTLYISIKCYRFTARSRCRFRSRVRVRRLWNWRCSRPVWLIWWISHQQGEFNTLGRHDEICWIQNDDIKTKITTEVRSVLQSDLLMNIKRNVRILCIHNWKPFRLRNSWHTMMLAKSLFFIRFSRPKVPANTIHSRFLSSCCQCFSCKDWPISMEIQTTIEDHQMHSYSRGAYPSIA